MKKLLLIAVLAVVCANVFAQESLKTKEKQFEFGFVYGTNVNGMEGAMGIDLRSTWILSRKLPLVLAPDFNFYFPANGRAWDLNVNVRYVLNVQIASKPFCIYPYIGLSYGCWHKTITDMWDETVLDYDSYSENDGEGSIGANIGAGIRYDFAKNWGVTLDIRGRFISNMSQATIGLGVSHKFFKLKKKYKKQI